MARQDQSAQERKGHHSRQETSTLSLHFDTLRIDSQQLCIFLREVVVSRRHKEQWQHYEQRFQRRDSTAIHHARDQTSHQKETTLHTPPQKTHHRAKFWLIIAAITAIALWRTYHHSKK